MARCTTCGADNPDGSAFCKSCGARIPYQQPSYVYSDPQKQTDAVMSTGAYIGSILLMSLPLVGFILMIVWSFGGTYNLNRRNLARAALILTAIGVVVGILIAVLGGIAASSWFDHYGYDGMFQNYRY
jgi:uncharacterized membrane protein YvbJ